VEVRARRIISPPVHKPLVRRRQPRLGSPAGAVRVGCSGWSYSHWRGRFYPADLPEAEWFGYYARVFDTVEINNSFYRLPSAVAVAHWRAQAPSGFLFAVKANRYITHMKKLKDPRQALQQFLGRVGALGERLGPLLYQLPPHWRCDPVRLRTFLALLPRELTHVFEFRDPSWVCDEVFTLLADHGASVCVHDMSGITMPRLAVGPIAYVRFHGTVPGYAGGYAPATLRAWARWLHEHAAAGRPAFVYFNNDAEGRAIVDAQALVRALRRLG
jgi:uncharacterized protein YecE (DUF72 family)